MNTVLYIALYLAMALHVLKYFIVAYLFPTPHKTYHHIRRGVDFSNAKISQAHLLYSSIETGSFPWNERIGQWDYMPKILVHICSIFQKSLLLYFSQFSLWRNLSWITTHATVANMRRCRGFCPILTVVPQNYLFFGIFLNQNHLMLTWALWASRIHILYTCSLKLFSQIYERHFYPSARIGLEGYCRHLPGGRAGVTSHPYRSPGRSSYRIAVKLGGDESWGRIWDEFVHGRRGSLIKRLMS